MNAQSSGAKREAAKIEQVYLELRRDIEDGKYSANEHLVESPIARDKGVSRNTLRSVLVRLAQEGFVVLEPNRGARVRAFSLEEVREVLLAREVLEGLVTRMATENLLPDDAAELREVVSEAEVALKADDIAAFSKANRQFHTRIVDLAGSSLIGSMLDGLRFPMMKFQFQALLVPGRKSQQLAEHKALLDAILANDAERAESVARMHIRKIRSVVSQLNDADIQELSAR